MQHPLRQAHPNYNPHPLVMHPDHLNSPGLGLNVLKPLILKPEAYEDWLDPGNKEPAKIEELLKTKYVRELKSYPVSKLVNRLENNSRECMEPLSK